MLWHLVLMKARAGLSADDRRALVDAFDQAIREIPTVRDVHVGRRIVHGASYERAVPDSADFMVSIGFDDLAGLQAYLEHPTHERLAVRYHQCVSSGLAYDFEVEGVEGLRRLSA